MRIIIYHKTSSILKNLTIGYLRSGLDLVTTTIFKQILIIIIIENVVKFKSLIYLYNIYQL